MTNTGQNANTHAVQPASLAATPPASIGFILRKLVWLLALAGLAVAAVDGFFSYQIQSGAPQQAASAAWSCFLLIGIYTIARGLDELTRGMRGV